MSCDKSDFLQMEMCYIKVGFLLLNSSQSCLFPAALLPLVLIPSLQAIARDNAKNYQLWNHRRKCALMIGRGICQAELDFTEEVVIRIFGISKSRLVTEMKVIVLQVLDCDAKNYHAWSHRQAIVTAFGVALSIN